MTDREKMIEKIETIRNLIDELYEMSECYDDWAELCYDDEYSDAVSYFDIPGRNIELGRDGKIFVE